MHTLPLPKVTENNLQTKPENQSARIGTTAVVPRTAKFGPQAAGVAPQLSPQQLQFLIRVAPAALESQRSYQIPACVTVAQAILESATAAGWGSSSLFRLANNPFGIKYCHYGRAAGGTGDGPSGHSPATSAALPGSRSSELKPQEYGAFEAATWEIENGHKETILAQFQRFPNLEEAFRAHALLLSSARYRPAFEVRQDWKKFAERLGPKSSPLDSEHCGYSTNPSYAAELVKLVKLYRLDDPRAQQWFATGRDPGTIGASGEPDIGSSGRSGPNHATLG